MIVGPCRPRPEPTKLKSRAALIWSVADPSRGDFKQSEYGRFILPFTLLRRLDGVLGPTTAAVLAEYRDKEQAGRPAEEVRAA